MNWKKGLKYVGIAVGVLVLGAVLLGVLDGLIGKGQWNLGWTDYTYDDSDYRVDNASIPSDRVTAIDLDWIDGKVQVVLCQDAYVSITETAGEELNEGSRVHWRVSEDGKTLSIKYRESSKFFGVSKNKNKDLILRIPERLLGQLESLTITCVSSEVTVSDVVAEQINVKTSTGDVTLELPEATAFILTCESRNEKAPTIDFPVTKQENTYVCGTDGIRISVQTTSGEVTVKRLED